MINQNDEAHGLKPLDLRKPSDGSSEVERMEESKDESEGDNVVNPQNGVQRSAVIFEDPSEEGDAESSINKDNMENLAVAGTAAAVVSSAPQFADEWGDTPGDPDEGPEPQISESPRVANTSPRRAEEENGPRRESLRKEKPIQLGVPEVQSSQIQSPRITDVKSTKANYALQQRLQMAKLRNAGLNKSHAGFAEEGLGGGGSKYRSVNKSRSNNRNVMQSQNLSSKANDMIG